MMVDKFFDYLQFEKRYSVHTLKAYKNDLTELEDYLIVYQSDTVIVDAVFNQLRSFIVFLSERNYTNRSINRKISSVKRFYKYLRYIEEIDVNPSMKLVSLKQESSVVVPYSKAEMINLFDNELCESDFDCVRDKLLISIFYNTGIRLSELIGIKLKDVDYSNSQLRVLGKRNKERIIPISAQLISEIEKYAFWRDDIEVVEGNFALFITKNGKELYSSLVYRVINSYLSKVTKKVKRSPHIIRHTFATHLLDAGADLNSIKELLGHSSVVATQIYTHVSISKLKSIVNIAHPRAKK
ncbi:MAG: tyrosine-type recombinase/integrase [Ichthyobacteriaceae bacterium]|nr:tyrosine-type recombinase/integrase [Ichthyobacteriaceae bacterium]